MIAGGHFHSRTCKSFSEECSIPSRPMETKNRKDLPDKIVKLIKKGVHIPQPGAVYIGEDVPTDRISGKGVSLLAGTRITGSRTLICSGVKLGGEGPVTVEDCLIGPDASLGGGYCRSSVFLEGASVGGGAQVREGCLLEEQASCAHTVGLKQTILFPFVTLGSLINFCDCLMGGGTSRRNHSEVGSSYIHFNYTPNQDKATPSLLGDVPSGVMLRQPPIFLGGQGGLVGPARIGYGTVIAAGTIYGGDCPEGGKLLGGAGRKVREKSFTPGYYPDISRKVRNNIFYIANIVALRQWYRHVRRPFFETQDGGAELCSGALEILGLAIEERVRRFGDFTEKMEQSIAHAERLPAGAARSRLLKQKREVVKNRPALMRCLSRDRGEETGAQSRDAFVKAVFNKKGKAIAEYTAFIQSLEAEVAAAGTLWLAGIVEDIAGKALEQVPSCSG